MKTLLATIQRLEDDFSIPDSFEESCMLSKEEIVDEDTVTSEDLSKFSDDLLVCCSSFQHNGTDMLLSAIIDEDKHICMYLISEGESTIDSVITKRIIPVL